MANQVPKRMHYFDHQFLRVDDFQTEQDYHKDMRRLHSRLLHTWGIAGDGLVLGFAAGAKSVKVSPGTAIDKNGQEIVLAEEFTTPDLSAYKGKTIFVAIRYGEHTSDPTTETGVTGDTRTTESPAVEVVGENPPADPGLQLILGRVTVGADGTVSSVDAGVEPNQRRVAGVVGGDLTVHSLALSDAAVNPNQWPRMHLGAPGRADLTGALEVSGDVHAGGTLRGTLPDNSIAEGKLDAAARGKLVTSGDAHDHAGGDGAQIRHSTVLKDDGRNPHGTTAADTGALPAAGGAVAGNLDVGGSLRVAGAVSIPDNALGETKLDAATRAKLMPTGILHNHVGGNSGAVISHSAIIKDDGRNPHGTTAADTGALPAAGGAVTGNLDVAGALRVAGPVTIPDNTLNEMKLDVATRGKLVTAGNTHDHVGGDGAQIRHSTVLKDDGRNPHATTAADVGALPVTGGDVAGQVTFRDRVTHLTAIPSGPATLLWNGHPQAAWTLLAHANPNLQSAPGSPAAAIAGASNVAGVYGGSFASYAGAHALFVSGTSQFTGAKTGYVADVFVNRSGQRLHTGDVVKLKGTPVVHFHGDGNKIPVSEVTLADTENDSMTIGIVDREALPDHDRPDTRVGPEDPSYVEDGGELYVVTLGTYAHCKVDAGQGPIAVGDLLTSSANPGHAKKAKNPQVGSIIGKALEPLKEGTGYIAVFVNIQ